MYPGGLHREADLVTMRVAVLFVTSVVVSVCAADAFAQDHEGAPTPGASGQPDGSADPFEEEVPGAPPPRAGPPPRPVRPPARRRPLLVEPAWEEREESRPAKRAGRASGFALELGMSQLNAGGLLLGGASAKGFVLGMTFDLLSTSTEVESAANKVTNTTFRLGLGTRVPLLRTPGGAGELIVAGDAALVFARRTTDVANDELTGYTWAVGPGLRLWLVDQISLGFLGRLRRTAASGEDPAVKVEETAIETTFFALGVF